MQLLIHHFNYLKSIYIFLRTLLKGGNNLANTSKKKIATQEKVKLRPALSPENEENQLISLANNLAKQRIMDGTASDSLLIQFIKAGTTKAMLEKEKLEEENKLLKAKTEMIQSQKDVDESYKKVLAALKEYSGVNTYDEY